MKKKSIETIGGFTSKKELNTLKPLTLLFGLLLLFVSGASAQTAVLDHFNCYITPGQPLVPQEAFLSDQFDVRDKIFDSISDIRMALFCNPVKKTVISSTVIPTVPIAHPDAHLAMYLTTPQGTAVPRSVQVSNQFGTQTLVTGEAEILAVPSGKTPIPPNGGPVSLPPIPEPGELDHFRCYSASGPSINQRVLLNDQFFVSNAEAATVLTPRLFCNPVSKSVPPPSGCPAGMFCQFPNTPITHPGAHMVCYLMSPATPFTGVVAYNNQFVPAGTLPTVKLMSPDLLCVPSTKAENWTDIPANPLAP